MAIIKCPNCGEYISDKASQCVHCTFELDNHLQTQTESNVQLTDEVLQAPTKNRTFNTKKTLILVFSALFSLFVVIGIIISSPMYRSRILHLVLFFPQLSGHKT